MKIPPKPRRGKRSPFYWWRRWKSHQYLPVKKGLLARIQNGDFEYPELFDWAKYELHYMKDELKAYTKEYMASGSIYTWMYFEKGTDCVCGNIDYQVSSIEYRPPHTCS